MEIAYSLEEEKNRAMLISDGVECILINKKFLYRHMSASTKILLKTLVNKENLKKDNFKNYF